MDGRLKKIIVYYTASALFAALFVSAAIISESYSESLAKTSEQFQTLKINSVKMKRATTNMGETAAKLISLIPSSSTEVGMESAILLTVDTIKSRFKDAQISISNFDKQQNEVSLPLSMSGTIKDYMSFVNDIDYLQSLVSPVFFMETVSISKTSESDKEMVVFEIRGTLKFQSNTI